MDHAKRGSDALEKGDYATAVTLYTDALKQLPQAVDYYIKRSTAYTRLAPPKYSEALEDSEIAVSLATKRAKRELIASAQLRRAVALFSLEKYADARQCLQWVKKLNEKEKSLAIWEMKIDSKLKDVPEGAEKSKAHVKEVPDVEVPRPDANGADKKQTHAATESTSQGSDTTSVLTPGFVQTPPSKIRHEWYQQSDAIIVSLFAKGVPADKAVIEINSQSLSVSFPLPTGSDFDFSLDPLFARIDAKASSHKIMSTKVEFTLRKELPGQKWPTLEGTAPHDIPNGDGSIRQEPTKSSRGSDAKSSAGPTYPTSSRAGPKDWDKVVSDLTQKPDKKDGEEADDEYAGEEGDPVNNFFQTLYKGADEDTKRAMMKSYQESNGTALSTNWDEVRKGKVETTPPDGMEAKKWA